MAKEPNQMQRPRSRRLEFRWENFRSFQDTGWIGVKPITVFIGANNTGKTSLVRPLLLMKQTMDSRDTRIALKTTGPLADVGTFSDLVFRHRSKLMVRFRLRFSFPKDSATPKKLKPIGAYPPGEVWVEFRAGSEPMEIKLYRLTIRDIYGRVCLIRTLLNRHYSLAFGRRLDARFLKLARASEPVHFLFPGLKLLRQIIEEAEKRSRRGRSKEARKARRRARLTLKLSEGNSLYIRFTAFVEEQLTKLFSRLTDATINILKRRLPETEGPFVFPGKEDNDKPLTTVRKAHHKTLRAASIDPPFRLYDFRHTYGSRTAMAGVDLPTLKELMGHADISTTMRYVHPTPEHKRQAVRKLERYNIEQVFRLYETGPSSPQKSPQ